MAVRFSQFKKEPHALAPHPAAAMLRLQVSSQLLQPLIYYTLEIILFSSLVDLYLSLVC
ncbi:MAG: hypothetical protein ACKPKO_31165 [Candidatus Fonsibacter sp.]